MTENVRVKDASGDAARIAADEVATLNGTALDPPAFAQRVKVGYGPDGSLTDVKDADGYRMPVDQGAAGDTPPALATNAKGVIGWLRKLADLLAVLQAVPSDVGTTLTDGRKTVAVAGTAEAIRGSLACKWVTVTALLTNTQQVNVGGSGALATLGSSTGTPLQAGSSITLPVDNANKVFVDARVSGEGVSFTVGA